MLSVIYYGFVAQPEYESVAKIALRGPEQSQRLAVLREHMVSRDMLAELDGQGFSEHFTRGGDPLTRLPMNAGSEQRSAMFAQHVSAEADAHTGIITLRVRAFSGAAAQRFAKVILREANMFLTNVGGSSADDVQKAATNRLRQVEERLMALERAAETPSTDPARVVMLRRQLAERELESALRAVEHSMEAARADVNAVVLVAAPSLPTEASHPRRGYGVITVLLISLLVFGIGSLLIAAVREHAQF